jgi:hypothetical protein
VWGLRGNDAQLALRTPIRGAGRNVARQTQSSAGQVLSMMRAVAQGGRYFTYPGNLGYTSVRATLDIRAPYAPADFEFIARRPRAYPMACPCRSASSCPACRRCHSRQTGP